LVLPFILTSLKDLIFEFAKSIFDSVALKFIYKSRMSIPIERLYEERIQIEKEKENYRKAIDRERKYRIDYNDLENKYSELNIQYNKDKESFNLKFNRFNPIHLDGLWKNTWKMPNSTKANSEILRIENGTIYKYKNEAQELYYGYILNFETDDNITSFRFTKNIVNSKLEIGSQNGYDVNKGTFLYNDLKYSQNGILSGTENGIISIKMERIEFQDLHKAFKIT
jgi:hypothetical protein